MRERRKRLFGRRDTDTGGDLTFEELRPGRFHWRRIPGTAVLAITNLFASIALFDAASFNGSADYARTTFEGRLWAVAFLLSFLFLVISIFTRRWTPLNVGSALSMFGWIAIGLTMLTSWVSGEVSLSPIVFPLIVWVIFGQMTMLFVPLLSRGRWFA